MKIGTFLRVWTRLLLRRRYLLLLAIVLSITLLSAALADPVSTLSSDDRGAPTPSPDPFP